LLVYQYYHLKTKFISLQHHQDLPKDGGRTMRSAQREHIHNRVTGAAPSRVQQQSPCWVDQRN